MPTDAEFRNLHLQSILDHKGTDPATVASQLCEVWTDELWKNVDDSFADFCEHFFQLSEVEAFVIMKTNSYQFSQDVQNKINDRFDALE